MMVALFSVMALVAGCSSSGGTVSTVDAAEFSQVASEPATHVIDVRTPAEYAAGHLDGAVNIDVEGSGFADQVAALDKDATYAVYCRSGNRSRTATQQMADAGIGTIYELGGGIVAWSTAGYQIVQ
jgi:phage shock protein E